MTADGGAAPETLDCPFCAEAIKPQALICKHCRRDVSIPMPLLLAQRGQAREIEALRCEILELRADLLTARLRPGEPAPPEGAGEGPAGASPPLRPRPASLLAGWGVALAGLLGLHALMVLRLDASVGALRAACIGWPLLVALLLPGLGLLPPRRLALLAASLGLIAVAGMSAVVAHVDGTPLLPARGQELFEVLEFALSITLAFAAGGLARRAVLRIRQAKLHRLALDRARGGLSRDSARKVTDQMETVKNLIEASVPLLAMGGAVIAGFRAIFGGE